MNRVVNVLVSKGVICHALAPVPLKELGTRKKVVCYLGVALDSRYVCVWKREGKGRLLSAEARLFEELVVRLEKLKNHRIFIKILLTHAPVCQKAEAWMAQCGWRVWRVPV